MPDVFDLFATTDVLVDDVDAAAARIVSMLGSPMWRESWVHDVPESRYRAYFLRVKLDRAVAPTSIEVIGPHPESGWNGSHRAHSERQQGRPMKTHASVISVPDVDEAKLRLERLGIPFHFESGVGSTLAFPRLWVGQVGSGDDAVYDPRWDAGLVTELIPTSALRLPPAPKPDHQVDPGLPVRVAGRAFLVDDLDGSCSVLEETFGWEPTSRATSAQDGADVASYHGSVPGGARLELLHPSGPGLAADHLGRYGAGAYRVTIAVNGLGAAADRLDGLDVAYASEPSKGPEPARLRIDPASFDGLVFELVDA